jgi:N-acetyl-gamma-glutamyl-phosphate reductase
MELARLLAAHPAIKLVCATSRTDAGKKLGELYPFLQGFELAETEIIQPEPELLAACCDLVFLAVPHGAAMEMAGKLRAKGLKVVDLSADFRLRDAATYAEWYGQAHNEPDCLAEAVYGLPELYAERIRTAKLVANPGCYPTASILGLYPALKNRLIHCEDLVIDAKSGTSGAGRKAAVGSLFCEVHDSFKPYGMPRHRHTPEIEQELTRLVAEPGLTPHVTDQGHKPLAGEALTVSFNPHLLPLTRGILASIYTRLRPGVDEAQIRAAYAEAYAGQCFVRLLPAGKLPELRNVRGTMFCDIALVPDFRTGRLLIFSAIDNLCRGASGQALANANLMCGLPLELGLEAAPIVP